VGEGLALKIVDTFLDTKFEGGRHQIRIDMVNELDNK
jgi:ribose 5-phosphate isomerase B